jgi:flagellin
MPLSIQTNVNSLVSQENLRVNSLFQSRTIQRLTSGYRINSSGDDAAGLAVANRFRSNTAELTQGVRNANDGVAQLQIIDGGLTNISQILDRMKTLATQSSSSTFTGNRATLNSEYSQLLSEIDRQAANVGLNTNGANNKKLGVYIGGATNGSAFSNNSVNVDLSGAAMAVDQTGLSLKGTSVAGAAIDMGAANTGAFMSGAAMTFDIYTIDATGAAKHTQFTGLSGANVTAQSVVDDLNRQVAADANTSSSGITFALDANNHLRVGGTAAFSVTTANAGGSQLLAADKTEQLNTALYNEKYTLVTATGAMNITFKNAAGESRTVAIANTDTAATQVDKINTVVKDLGIYAIRVNGTNDISLQSNNSFSWTSDVTNQAGLGAQSESQTAADLTLSPTAAAQGALSRITNAVTLLGNTQGIVGSGENKLAYAISLAQSQITNFSSAEAQLRDADVATEAANLTKAQVLQQASMAAMAQANSAPQAVLSLLRG